MNTALQRMPSIGERRRAWSRGGAHALGTQVLWTPAQGARHASAPRDGSLSEPRGWHHEHVGAGSRDSEPPGADAQIVDPELDVITMVVKVPETLAHLHYWAAELTRPAAKDEVLAAFRSSTRIMLIRYSDGLLALNAVKEFMSAAGRVPTSTRWRCGMTC